MGVEARSGEREKNRDRNSYGDSGEQASTTDHHYHYHNP